MPYEGHCNCGNIQVVLDKQPEKSILCHCHNCRRAGGSSSVNYVIDPGELQLNDPHASLSTYFDQNTTSGNTIARRFCGSCGSPITTQTPQYPDKIIIKASLFDSLSAPAIEAFTQRRETWMKPIDDAQQK